MTAVMRIAVIVAVAWAVAPLAMAKQQHEGWVRAWVVQPPQGEVLRQGRMLPADAVGRSGKRAVGPQRRLFWELHEAGEGRDSRRSAIRRPSVWSNLFRFRQVVSSSQE